MLILCFAAKAAETARMVNFEILILKFSIKNLLR